MNKELKEAIERLSKIDETVQEYDGNILKKDIQTVLNYIENSIPKQEVEERLYELKNPDEEFKKLERKYCWYKDRRIGAIEVLSGLLEAK